jgi:hypothetical protein
MTDLPWEDCLLERKTESDLRDLPKTLVAFANSVKPEHTAVILIGEKDDGTVQGVTDADNIQKTIRKHCDKIYPPIIWKSKVYEKDGKTCVRIEIEYDGETPHFGDAAWVRRGSETIKATDEVFQKLIELRLGKVRELAKWIDKDVRFEIDRRVRSANLGVTYEKFLRQPSSQNKATLLEVNSFWVKLHLYSLNTNHSVPLENTTLNWDDDNNCLKLIINP